MIMIGFTPSLSGDDVDKFQLDADSLSNDKKSQNVVKSDNVFIVKLKNHTLTVTADSVGNSYTKCFSAVNNLAETVILTLLQLGR